MTPLERAQAALERGPLTQLELTDDDVAGLDAPSRRSMTKKVLYLRAFARRGIVLDGQEAASVARTTVKFWRDTDEWFAKLEEQAQEEAADRIEAAVHHRAIDGYDEPVIFQGLPTMVGDPDNPDAPKKVFTVKKYDSGLAALLLKGNRRDKYSERVDNKHSFEGQTGVLIVPAGVAPEEWAKAAREQQAKYAGNTGEEKK